MLPVLIADFFRENFRFSGRMPKFVAKFRYLQKIITNRQRKSVNFVNFKRSWHGKSSLIQNKFEFFKHNSERNVTFSEKYDKFK